MLLKLETSRIGGNFPVDGEQAESGSGSIMDNGMYPYRESGQQPQAGWSQFPLPQSAHPGSPMQVAEPPARGKGIATAALVLGICACLAGLLGYFSHGIGMTLFVAALGLAAFVCGVVGRALNDRMGVGSRGMAGILLGASGIVLFLVLGATAAGGLDRLFATEPASAPPAAGGTVSPSSSHSSPTRPGSSPSGGTTATPGRTGGSSGSSSGSVSGTGSANPDTSLRIQGGTWEGTVVDGDDDVFFPTFTVSDDGSCEWCDDQIARNPKILQGHAEVLYDDDAARAAADAGFDVEGLTDLWSQLMHIYPSHRLVFLNFRPEGEPGVLLPEEGERWFGYCLTDTEDPDMNVIWMQRMKDGTPQPFFRE